MAQSKEATYDLLVIGSGPAGVHAAYQAAKLKKRVAVIEAKPHALGGAWIHTGTLPSKTLREVLDTIHNIKSHLGPLWVQRIVRNLSTAQLRSRAGEVSAVEEDLVRKHLENNHIDLVTGFGVIEDPHAVRVVGRDGASRLLRTEHILIATGSKPRRPPEIPFDGWRVVDSDDILNLDHLPGSIVIFGAGVIGCEYACIFSALGVKTVIVDARSRIMQSLDHEITDELKRCMEAMGITFRMGLSLKGLVAQGSTVRADFGAESLTTDLFFFAAGRESNTQRIGLDRVGISTNDRGTIAVNACFQTDIPNIYAAGDAIGPPALAATSALQGRMAVCHAFRSGDTRFPTVYPVGVYTIPELSSVGQSEEELIAANVDYVVGHASYEEIARGHIRGDKHGMLKILAHRRTQQLLGVHIVGADAANLIHIGQTAMLSKMPLIAFADAIVFNYPTLAEGYKIAAFNALNKIFPSGIFCDPEPEAEASPPLKGVA